MVEGRKEGSYVWSERPTVINEEPNKGLSDVVGVRVVSNHILKAEIIQTLEGKFSS